MPLYPFSRQSLYDPTFQPTLKEVEEATAAPSPEINVSALAGRTGERLRAPAQMKARSQSQSQRSQPALSPPQPQITPPQPQLHEPSSYVMDSLDFFDGTVNGPGMISAQGMWRPIDLMGPGDDGLPDFLGQFGL